jgi:hypothetical protein
MKWPCRTLAAACIVLGLASASPAGQVKLEIRDGLVTLDARDATIREIFAEWARVGQTRVMNAERVPGGPVTLQLNAVPERKALDIVLRSVAGYVAAPRTVAQSAGSQYDRILLMPVSRPAVVPTSGTANSTPSQLQFQRERNVQPPPVVVDDQDDPQPSAQMPIPSSSGAPLPGMMTPAPQQAQPSMPQMPYGVRQPPAGDAQPAGPQPATRPGMPTAPPGTPIKPPDPIIK